MNYVALAIVPSWALPPSGRGFRAADRGQPQGGAGRLERCWEAGGPATHPLIRCKLIITLLLCVAELLFVIMETLLSITPNIDYDILNSYCHASNH